jgi:hypothetical protein
MTYSHIHPNTKTDTKQIPRVHFCHCSNCRKSSGSYVSANLSIARTEVTILDPQGLLKTYEDCETGSGNVVMRGFCGACGWYASLPLSVILTTLRFFSFEVRLKGIDANAEQSVQYQPNPRASRSESSYAWASSHAYRNRPLSFSLCIGMSGRLSLRAWRCIERVGIAVSCRRRRRRNVSAIGSLNLTFLPFLRVS